MAAARLATKPPKGLASRVRRRGEACRATRCAATDAAPTPHCHANSSAALRPEGRRSASTPLRLLLMETAAALKPRARSAAAEPSRTATALSTFCRVSRVWWEGGV